jgi:hypothetical protein
MSSERFNPNFQDKQRHSEAANFNLAEQSLLVKGVKANGMEGGYLVFPDGRETRKAVAEFKRRSKVEKAQDEMAEALTLAVVANADALIEDHLYDQVDARAAEVADLRDGQIIRRTARLERTPINKLRTAIVGAVGGAGMLMVAACGTKSYEGINPDYTGAVVSSSEPAQSPTEVAIAVEPTVNTQPTPATTPVAEPQIAQAAQNRTPGRSQAPAAAQAPASARGYVAPEARGNGWGLLNSRPFQESVRRINGRGCDQLNFINQSTGGALGNVNVDVAYKDAQGIIHALSEPAAKLGPINHFECKVKETDQSFIISVVVECGNLIYNLTHEVKKLPTPTITASATATGSPTPGNTPDRTKVPTLEAAATATPQPTLTQVVITQVVPVEVVRTEVVQVPVQVPGPGRVEVRTVPVPVPVGVPVPVYQRILEQVAAQPNNYQTIINNSSLTTEQKTIVENIVKNTIVNINNPTAVPTVPGTASPTATETKTATATNTAVGTNTPGPSPTGTPSRVVTIATYATATGTPSATAIPTITSSPTTGPSATTGPSVTPSNTPVTPPSPTTAPSSTPEATPNPSITPSLTPTLVRLITPTPAPFESPTSVPPTRTPAVLPSNTPIPTITLSPIPPTSTPRPLDTRVVSPTPAPFESPTSVPPTRTPAVLPSLTTRPTVDVATRTPIPSTSTPRPAISPTPAPRSPQSVNVRE